MPLEVICRQCKKPYTTAPGDVLSGTWRLCPSCRPPLVEDAMNAPADRRALFEDAAPTALPVTTEIAG